MVYCTCLQRIGVAACVCACSAQFIIFHNVLCICFNCMCDSETECIFINHAIDAMQWIFKYECTLQLHVHVHVCTLQAWYCRKGEGHILCEGMQ